MKTLTMITNEGPWYRIEVASYKPPRHGKRSGPPEGCDDGDPSEWNARIFDVGTGREITEPDDALIDRVWDFLDAAYEEGRLKEYYFTDEQMDQILAVLRQHGPKELADLVEDQIVNGEN